jgi:DUF1365 family protein
MAVSASILHGKVVHKRLRPKQHKLQYRVFSLACDVDKLEDIAKESKLFSLNKFNLFSLAEKQHGHRDGTPISEFAWGQVRTAGLSNEVKRVVIYFYPRIFGFAFNPLTVYFCLDERDQPVLMLYEVRNTFGENLTYVLPAGKNQNGTFTHSINKEFYVSPFNNVEGDYDFHVRRNDVETTIGVALRTQEGPLLRTHFRGKRSKFSDRELLKALFRYPLMTLKIVAGIHWEALKLWRKGLTLKDRPPAPQIPIVYGGGLTPPKPNA